jgi:hypothetical protein
MKIIAIRESSQFVLFTRIEEKRKVWEVQTCCPKSGNKAIVKN